MEIHEKIKELRQKRGWSQTQLAKKLGYQGRSEISKIESGSRRITSSMMMNLSEVFDVPPSSFMSDELSKRIVPVYGKVAAGIPIEAITDIEDYEEIDEKMAKSGEYIALKIRGDSMEPRMFDGDTVIVRLQPDCESGDIAVCMIGGCDATCKRVKKTSRGIMLISLNPNYEPMIFSPDDIGTPAVSILGKVVELRAKI